MKIIKTFYLLIMIFSLTGCGNNTIIPTEKEVDLNDAYTIIWYGKSESYKYDDGKWVRAEENDYQFTVTQKRYKNHWESVKNLHHLHPDYNDKLGDRNKTMYFEVDYVEAYGDSVHSVIKSSLGNGIGATDTEFREAEINIYPEKSNFLMPYNKFRITQQYNYELGVLTETVELIKEKDGKETPFMKNEEIAYFYTKSMLDHAPTVFEE